MAFAAQILPLVHTHTGIWPLVAVVDNHEQGSREAPWLDVAPNERLFNILFNLIVHVSQAFFAVRGPGCALEAGLLISSQACSPCSLLRLSLLPVVR